MREGVTIEDEVLIGHGVTFIHDTYPRATILCNVISGEHAIVGAGTTKSVPGNAIVAGKPARALRTLAVTACGAIKD